MTARKGEICFRAYCRRPRIAGKFRCAECIKEGKRRPYLRLLDRKLCPRCTKRPAGRHSRMCEPCRKEHNAKQLLDYRNAKAAGCCTECGLPSGGRARCASCEKRRNERRSQR